MSIIEKFLVRYSKEFDFYLEAARLCAQQCETGLESSGIRAIVTYRAKRPDRLRDKLEQRNQEKKYRKVEDIYKDMVDLAGVRIALYFPGDRDEVYKFIQSNFIPEHKKDFPTGAKPSYDKRFSGYWANHYHVYLKSDGFTESNKRYGQALIEIQVASVLMHAWAEVEHDLVYKPLSGKLSDEEYAILDELNGLVLTGEIALERLQKSFKVRVGEGNKRFNNHYELSAFLYDSVQPLFTDKGVEPVMGRADILFKFLQLAGLDKPDSLKVYITELDPDTEKRPIVDQIVDQILSKNTKLYDTYNKARFEIGGRNPYKAKGEKPDTNALGYFISRWIVFESAIRQIAREINPKLPEQMILRLDNLQKLNVFKNNVVFELEYIRRLRNQVVHGIEVPSDQYLITAGQFLENAIKELSHSLPDELKPIVISALDKISSNS